MTKIATINKALILTTQNGWKIKYGSHNGKGISSAMLFTQIGVTGGRESSKKGSGHIQCEHELCRMTEDNMK